LYAHRWLTLDALSSAITPAITAPLLTGGANKGRLKVAKAQREQALNQYLNAVNAACGEVEIALARLQASHHNLTEQTLRQQAVLDKVSRIHTRYEVGLDSEPTYWLAALEAVPVQSEAIVERAQVALDTANLMTALGSGFKPSGAP
jgi:multidrug efflux system outer membrane protein